MTACLKSLKRISLSTHNQQGASAPYLKEKPMNYCKECDGWGEVTVEVAKPHGFNRDVGYLDTDKQVCEACEGTGEQTNE